MLIQRYGVHCVPRAFDTTVFVSLMDSVEGPLDSATPSVADLSPSLSIADCLTEDGWKYCWRGYHLPRDATKNSLNSGLGLSLPLPLLGYSAHSWLNEWSIGHSHISPFADMSFKIHGPKLSVRSISMPLFGRTNAAG